MAWFQRNGRSQALTHEAEPRVDIFKSLGLMALLQSLKAERKYRILELGPAIGCNITFLSEFSSRIRVEDLYTTLTEAKFFDRGEEPLEEGTLGRILSISDQERYDILLSWDLVNYFRPEEFRALVRYLDSFCAPGAFFFAISSTLKEMPTVPTNFKILGAETLQYCTLSSVMRPCPRYVPRDLSLMMSNFQVHSSYMLRNGMQEYVFVHK